MTPFLLYKDVITYDQSVPLSASVHLSQTAPTSAKGCKAPRRHRLYPGKGFLLRPGGRGSQQSGDQHPLSDLGRLSCVASLPQASPGSGGTRRLFTVIFTEDSGASVYTHDCFVLKHRRRENRATKPRGTANQAERLPGKEPAPASRHRGDNCRNHSDG